MHQTTVAKLEAGSRPTTLDELLALARIFGVDPAALLPSRTDADLRVEYSRALDETARLELTARALKEQIADMESRLAAVEADENEAYERMERLRGLFESTLEEAMAETSDDLAAEAAVLEGEIASLRLQVEAAQAGLGHGDEADAEARRSTYQMEQQIAEKERTLSALRRVPRTRGASDVEHPQAP